MRKHFVLLLLLAGAAALRAQSTPATTNADVIKMVKGGLDESVIVAAIRSRPGNFDTSPDGLLTLHAAGVTKAELAAMLAIAAPGASPAATPAPPPPQPKLPTVTVGSGANTQPLPLEHTQLAQTRTKPTSMASLAGDSLLSQAIQNTANTATQDVASHIASTMGSSAVQQAGSIFGGFMARRKPDVTYVWGVPGPTSPNVLATSSPVFIVDYSGTPGVNPDDFEPAIVKLTPAQNTCRIVGATAGKADASTDPNWQVYSNFLEDRVPLQSQRLASGRYQISPQSALLPGEYAVVLRPVSRGKKFAGGDVARDQGDGMMFDTVWTFALQIAANGSHP